VRVKVFFYFANSKRQVIEIIQELFRVALRPLIENKSKEHQSFRRYKIPRDTSLL